VYYETGQVYPVVSVFADGELLILDIKELFTRYTNDVIATTAFGLRVDSLKQPSNEFYTMGQEATSFGVIKWIIFLSIPKVMKVRTVYPETNSSCVYVNPLKH
jgi:hypothetical protein